MNFTTGAGVWLPSCLVPSLLPSR